MDQNIVEIEIEKIIKEYEEEIEGIKNEIVELKLCYDDGVLVTTNLDKHEKLYHRMISLYTQRNLVKYRYYAPPIYFKARHD